MRLTAGIVAEPFVLSAFPAFGMRSSQRYDSTAVFAAGKLTQDAAEALQEHLERQLVEIGKAGEKWQENGLIFCTGKGTLINPTNLRRRSFAPLLKHAGLPAITFHQLRHTAATILLLRNVNPKVVSELLGHATIAITLDTYSHVLPNIQHSAVAAMEEAFS